jgi:hypothetical protein
MDRAVFEMLLARAGLPLTPAERDELHAASHHVVALMALLSSPRGVEVVPATIFVPTEPNL